VQPEVLRFRVEPDGVRLHARVWPAPPGAPTLVLLHGGGANAHWWDHIAPDLARVARVAALDFRGHGESDYPAEVVAGAFAHDLEALLRELAAPDAVLAGASMGGHVALEVAARAGARGASGPRGVAAIDVSRGAGRAASRRARLALALRRTYPSCEDAVARYRFVPPAAHVSEALRESIARHSARREADGRWGFAFDPRWFSLPPGERPSLAGIRCPVLLIRGTESPLLGREAAAALVAEIPDARLVEVEGAGHHVPLDRPDAVRAILLSFLAECAAGYAGRGGDRETP
jgi:pimeloyl-ACP methyl ester carboxylesterase